MTNKTSMEEASDEDLFIYMACANGPEDQALRDAAFAELHRRYVKDLYARCLRTVRAYPDSETLAHDLTSATLVRARDRSDQFRSDPDGNNRSSRTRAWLYRIALNLFRDHLRNPERPGPLSNVVDLNVNAEQYSPEDFAALFLGDESTSHSRHHHKRVAKAFDQLDDRTQIVLLETLLQRQKSPGRAYMLRSTAQRLADRMQTSTDNLRRIRRNGIRRINTYVNRHMNNDAETDSE